MVTIESTQGNACEDESLNEWRNRSERHRAALEGKAAPRFGIRATLNSLLAPLGVELVRRSDGEQSELDTFRAEDHHRSYGRPWCVGRDHFEYLLTRGLKKSDRFLDIGCGALRTGIWVISYLDDERYFGIESHLPSLRAAAQYEIPLNRLEPKRPALLHDVNLSLEHWGVTFDWIFAFSVFRHLTPDLRTRALNQVSNVITDHGRLLVNNGPPLPLKVMAEQYGLELANEERMPCEHAGRSIHWFEFKNTRA